MTTLADKFTDEVLQLENPKSANLDRIARTIDPKVKIETDEFVNYVFSDGSSEEFDFID